MARTPLPQAEFDRVAACFVASPSWPTCRLRQQPEPALKPLRSRAPAFGRWLSRNVHAHRNPQLRAVTLSFKRPGQAPGDATRDQLDAVAQLVDTFSRRRSARHPRPERAAALGARVSQLRAL